MAPKLRSFGCSPMLVAGLWALSLTWALPASAGPAPILRDLFFHPERPELIGGYAWPSGLVLSTDGGANFRFLCHNAAGIHTSDTPSWRYTEDGRILLSNWNGVQRSDAESCLWTSPDETLSDGFRVRTMVTDPADFSVSYAVTSLNGRPNGVFRNADAGSHWERLADFGESTFIHSVRVSHGQPKRIAISYRRHDPATDTGTNWVATSDDDGASWQEHPVELLDGETRFELLHIAANDADRMYALAATPHPNQQGRQLVPAGRIRVSRDAGQTWETLLEVGEFGGMAWTDDETVAWVGDDGGLWRSDDSGETFTRLHDCIRVSCLAYAHDKLWFCANNWVDKYSIGTSDDGGYTLKKFMRFQEVEALLSCSEDLPGGSIERVCDFIWTDWNYHIDNLTLPTDRPRLSCEPGDGPGDVGDAGTPAADAGTQPKEASGGCRIASASRSDGTSSHETTLMWMLGMVMVVLRARRQR